jgi:hypothetical protein
MEDPGHGIVGRESELARVKSFIGSVSEGPSASLLEGAAGIGKKTLWHAGVSIARTRGHRVLSCRAAESEARLSYAALLRAEVAGAPPDQRAVSVASLGVLRALAASGPVIVAIDDVQWLDAPSARVLAFVVRRLEDGPIRILAALRVGSGGDPLGLGQTGPLPLQRVPIGPLGEEAMTRLLRDRTEGDLTRPILLRLHRISEGKPALRPRDRPGPHQPGRPAGARRTAPRSGGSSGTARGTACRTTAGCRCDASCHRAVLGFLELSLSNPTAAMEQLDPVLAFLDGLGSPEPGIIPVVPDAIEALVSLGRLEEAEALLDRLEHRGRTLDRPWAIATAGRGRGLLTAARGDLSGARSALEQALVEHRRVPQPFELARTLLGEGRGGAQSQAEASRPLHPGTGA